MNHTNTYKAYLTLFVAVALLFPSSRLTSQEKPAGQTSANVGLAGKITASEAPYGNLLTDISATQFLKLGYRYGDQVKITIGQNAYELPFVRSYGDVPQKKPLLLVNPTLHLTIAVNMGNAQSFFDIKPPVALTIQKK